ncbi:MAG: hypothetical protein HY709_09520 [Candidatus Latescibacteria bacterium]|nr:hypothetical protein [Candidatus Latescibacterota bacterium]
MQRRVLYYLNLTGLIFVITLGCQSGRKQEVEKQAERPSKEQLPSGEITYTVPDGWVEQTPSSPMRRAQFGLPGVEGAGDAELAVFFFPGTGGTVEENLDRWYGQFTQPDGSSTKGRVEKKRMSVHGLPITMVYVTGTYLKSRSPTMMEGSVDEMPWYAMIAAVAETANGPWFFKATGPQKTIDSWRSNFERFVQSFTIKGTGI